MAEVKAGVQAVGLNGHALLSPPAGGGDQKRVSNGWAQAHVNKQWENPKIWDRYHASKSEEPRQVSRMMGRETQSYGICSWSPLT